MGASLRLIGLLCIARIRAAGLAPWLLLVGWLLMAVLQEPLMLRRYGINLLDDAAWSGSLLVTLVLLSAESRQPRRLAISINLVQLAVMAGLQAALAAALDRSYWSVNLGGRLWQAVAFFLAWCPLAIVLARPFPRSFFAIFRAMMVVLGALTVGSMLAVRLREGVDTSTFVAAALAILAALIGRLHRLVD